MAGVFAISLGAMMGSGIFVLPGLAAAKAGPWVAASYLLAGLFVLPALFSKAELATAMPVAGGVYVYADRSLGPWAGTVIGVGTWLALASKTAFALAGLGMNAEIFLDLPGRATGALALLALLVVNALGATHVSRLQGVVVAFTVAALALLVLAGLPRIEQARFVVDPLPHGLGGIAAGAAFVFVSYAGVTKVCSVAEEVRDPRRSLPRGMLLAQGAAMLLYAATAGLVAGLLPIEALGAADTPIPDVAGAIFGPAGITAYAVVAAVGLLSMSNAGIMASARYPFAMSRDGLGPERLGRVHPRTGTPLASTALTGALLLALLLFLPVEKLAKLASGITLFGFAANCLAVVLLRETSPRWYRPGFRSPLYPWMQVTGVAGGAWLLWALGAVGIGGVLGALAVGSAWYAGYARRRVSRTSVVPLLVGRARALRATADAERTEEDPEGRVRVVVPLFGGEPAPTRLVRIAAALADGGPVEVLRLEEVPELASLAAALGRDRDADGLARQAEEIGADAHVPVRFEDLVTHNAKEALHRHAVRTGAHWVVLERPTRRELHYLVRHPMAWWLDHPPCHLAILLDRSREADSARAYRRVLAWPQPGPYDTLVVHVADRVARLQQRGRVVLLGVLRPDAPLGEARELEHYLDQLGRLCTGAWSVRIERAADRLDAVERASAEADLLVLDSPGGIGLRTLFLHSFEHRVAERARCSVLRVRSSTHRALHDVAVTDERTGRHLLVGPHVDGAAAVPRARVARKGELFELVAHHLADSAGLHPEDVRRALDRVERRQNTHLGDGVAATAPVLRGAPGPVLGLFTLEHPVRYGGPGNPPVDVLVAVLGPPRTRQAQLGLLRRLTGLLRDHDLARELRAATSPEGLRNAVRAAAERAGEGR